MLRDFSAGSMWYTRTQNSLLMDKHKYNRDGYSNLIERNSPSNKPEI